MTTGSYQTKSRQMTLAFLEKNKNKTVSVAEITDYLHNHGAKTNITTVYRYLDKLVSEHIVFKYVSEDGEKAVFQYVGQESQCHEHLHLKCISCGKLEHMDCDFMKHIHEHMKEHHGFEVQCSKSVLYGYCKECLEQGKV